MALRAPGSGGWCPSGRLATVRRGAWGRGASAWISCRCSACRLVARPMGPSSSSLLSHPRAPGPGPSGGDPAAGGAYRAGPCSLCRVPRWCTCWASGRRAQGISTPTVRTEVPDRPGLVLHCEGTAAAMAERRLPPLAEAGSRAQATVTPITWWQALRSGPELARATQRRPARSLSATRRRKWYTHRHFSPE